MGKRVATLGRRHCTKKYATGLALLLVPAFLAPPAIAQDFKPHGTVKLEYESSYEKKGDVKTDQSTISQDYELTFDGYIWRHEFLTFESSFTYGDTMKDDSVQSESRDRNIDLYDITIELLPNWRAPMAIEVKRNITLLNSDTSLDTRSVEDTYRFQTELLYNWLPETDFEFERVDDMGEEIGESLTTDDTQSDKYSFTMSDTVFGKAQLELKYDRNEDRNNMTSTEDVSNAYSFNGTVDVSSNLRIDFTAEYRTNENESSTVVSSLALREDIDFITSIAAVSFYDATLPISSNIGDHMAIPLTPSGALDFADWTPSGFTTIISDVNNNQITFTDAVPADVMVLIAYRTQDAAIYFDIYRGDGSADTFFLTVTQVVITEGFDDYLVFARHISVAGGLVTLNFAPLTEPEPINSSSFPLTGVGVSIAYNTRSGNHFVDDFSGVDVEQSGTEFDLSKINPGEDKERLFEIEISYLPSSRLDLNFKYQTGETENETETATDHSWDAQVKYLFTDRLTSTTELSRSWDSTSINSNPDVDDPAAVAEAPPSTEEWSYMTKLEYSRPLGFANLDASYEYSFDTREEKGTSTADTTTQSINTDLTMGRTKLSSTLDYGRDENNDLTTDESTWSTSLNFDINAENSQSFRSIGLTTSLGYEYQLDKDKGEDDFTKNTYTFDEDIDYKSVSLKNSVQYHDEENGDAWMKELDLSSDVEYSPLGWLDLSAGISWTNTEDEQEDNTGTDAFIEGDIHFKVGRSATVELGMRREWLWDDPGEDEESFEFDAKFSYVYAEFEANLELDYRRTDFNGESDNTEDYGFKVTLEREF